MATLSRTVTLDEAIERAIVAKATLERKTASAVIRDELRKALLPPVTREAA